MLTFRIKSVLSRREMQNAVLLFFAALPVHLFLATLAGGQEALIERYFLTSLFAFAFFGVIGFALSSRKPLTSVTFLLIGVLSFLPGYYFHTQDWRWFLVGLAPSIYLGVCLFIIAWHLYCLNRGMEEASFTEKSLRSELFGPRTSWIVSQNWLAIFCLGFALYRYHSQNLNWLCWSFAGLVGALALFGSFLGEYFLFKQSLGRLRWLILLPLLGFVGSFLTSHWAEGILCAMAALVLVDFHYRSKVESFSKFSNYFFQHPALLLVSSFLGVILIGTYLLALPWVLQKGHSLEVIDAFFLSTSATCVTGLASVDISKVFSFSGQLIILGLIQVGGLGIMTLSTFSAIVLGRAIGLRQEYFVKDMLGENRHADVLPLTIFICVATFAIEALGAATLIPQLMHLGMGFKEALWKSVFHSVSAFCNGGLSLQSDSLLCFEHHPWILFTITMLIVAGGLGFGVLSWLCDFLRFKNPRSNFYVNVVLTSTIVLLVFGTSAYLFFDGFCGMEHLNWVEKISNSFFYSATARTAGFSTFDINEMSKAGRLCTMILMFIGGAPGSTAGGVKLTTLVVFLSMILSVMRGRDEITYRRHTFAPQTAWRATVIFLLYLISLLIGFLALLKVEDMGFEEVLFETISALCTTGLSMGVTERLSAAGKLIVIVLMFVGRLGPLTFLLLVPTRRRSVIEYPNARLMVG